MIINISNRPNIYGQVGRRVEYTGDMANQSGKGAIVAINEATRFAPLSADILLEDGRILPAVYCHTIVHISEAVGCRHRVLALDDDFATEEEIAGLHAKRALKIAADKARKDAADQAFAAEVERLKAEYPDLVSGDDRKAAAANIRKLLKRFKGVKFSVTSDHSSINVRWTDGPTEKTVEDLVSRFKEGDFDGSDDCYKYSISPWNKCFGGVRYVFANRERSDELVQRAIDALVFSIMVSQEEIRDLIAKAKAKGAIVNVSFDRLAKKVEGRDIVSSIQAIGLNGFGPYPVGPIAFRAHAWSWVAGLKPPRRDSGYWCSNPYNPWRGGTTTKRGKGDETTADRCRSKPPAPAAWLDCL